MDTIPHHGLHYTLTFLEVESFFLSLYLLYDFITVGKKFKRITGKFTWKPPEGYD
ncbi:MAG: hypothetical protein M1597_01100 [Candidatus Thermoplasmatota archaeon]|nr:hypothetical protein [Candidatus Thermoplasmatota archaeon]